MSTEFIDVAITENIQRELWLQCKNEEFCDVALIAGTKEKRIPAHSNILSAASQYFKSILPLFENPMKEIKLPRTDSDILQSLVKYCYTGRITIRKDIAVELLKTADDLYLHKVVRACGNILVEQLQPRNCLEYAHLAQRYHCETLLQKARNYSLEHFMLVRKTDEFLRLNAAQLSDLFACDNLTVSSEEIVFNSLLAWIRHDSIKREKYKAELLKLVRLPLLKTTFLKEHVKPICTSTECREIYVGAIDGRLLYGGKSNGRKSVKPKKPIQRLMGITREAAKMHIHYYCTQRLKWMKWSKSLCTFGWPSVAVMEDNLYFVGGAQSDGIPLNTVICVNLKTMHFMKIIPMTVHRKRCGVTVLNGFLYAVGGANKADNSLNSVEKWNEETITWTKVASMAVSRSSFGIAVLNEKLFAVGGVSSDGRKVNSAEFYDPHQNAWTSIASMHEARFHFDVAVCKGLLYAVGGDDGIKTVESYNPETNSWTMLSNITDYLSEPESCTTFRDKVIVWYRDRVEEYHEETNEWKTSATLKVLENNHRTFTYSNELYTTAFFEN